MKRIVIAAGLVILALSGCAAKHKAALYVPGSCVQEVQYDGKCEQDEKRSDWCYVRAHVHFVCTRIEKRGK